jgi:pimeloyl-ACP methyl ester carboxylesterase
MIFPTISKFATAVACRAVRSIASVLILGSVALASGTGSAADGSAARITIVLVHGAMADSSSWNGIIPRLQARGYAVLAAANPLRGLKSDADYLSRVVKSVKGPVVLVGHSYGGSVITNAATGNSNVKALVYVAAFAPDAGESAFDLVGRFPGSILGAALAPPVELSGGGNDLYVDQAKFRESFAADVAEAQVKVMAATLRPVTEAALKDPSAAPAWKTVPSWFVYGSADKSIPATTHAFMAERAGAKKVVVVKGASHVVMVSQPAAVAQVIDEAVMATVSSSY